MTVNFDIVRVTVMNLKIISDSASGFERFRNLCQHACGFRQKAASSISRVCGVLPRRRHGQWEIFQSLLQRQRILNPLPLVLF